MYIFTIFRYYLSFDENVALHWNKLKSPSLKNSSCQIWLILANCMALEKKKFFFSKSRQCIFTMSLLSSFEDVEILLNKLDPLHPSMLCPKFSKIVPVVLEKKQEAQRPYWLFQFHYRSLKFYK